MSFSYDGQTYLNGLESDPRLLGWSTQPTDTGHIVRFENGDALQFPRSRFSLSNAAALFPTKNILSDPINHYSWTELHDWQSAIESLSFTDLNHNHITWFDFLSNTYTDGLAISHRGKLIYEYYFGAMQPNTVHLGFSLTKSIVMGLALYLFEAHKIDHSRLISDFLPALNRSAFASASLNDLLDMRLAVDFDERVDRPDSHAMLYAKASNMHPYAPQESPQSMREFLSNLNANGAHGGGFRYLSVHTEVLGWILESISGIDLPTLLSECLWRPMGAGLDANIIVDMNGIPICGAGMSLGLRDLVLFGELMRLEGALGGRQILPAHAIRALYDGGSVEAFSEAGYTLLPGYRYHRQWWVTDPKQHALEGRGIYGQRLYIAPQDELTIARFSSHPVATSAANDPLTIPAIQALRALVRAQCN